MALLFPFAFILSTTFITHYFFSFESGFFGMCLHDRAKYSSEVDPVSWTGLGRYLARAASLLRSIPMLCLVAAPSLLLVRVMYGSRS